MEENPSFADARERVGFDLAEAADWDREKILDNLNYYKRLMKQPSACWSGSSSSCSSAKYHELIDSIFESMLPDARLIGASGSVAGVYGVTGGVEQVYNIEDDEWTGFTYMGNSMGISANASLAAYGGLIWNLEDNMNYEGDFASLNLRVNAGEGFFVSLFWDPTGPLPVPWIYDTTWGIAGGKGLGLGAELSGAVTTYECTSNCRKN